MGVTVRQKLKGKGKPWWVFIAHNGKRKSIKEGDRTAAEALAQGWGEVPDLVFLNHERRMINFFNLRPRVFHAALEKAGQRRIRIHDLRHTFASLPLQNGESIVYVKDQLGHGSISITVDTYGHLVPGANRQAVDK